MPFSIQYYCPIVQLQTDQNSQFYLYSLSFVAGSGTLIPDPDLGKSTGSMRIRIHNTAINTVLFGQAPPKPYQNHHLDPISLSMDGSGLLKPGSGLAKKPGSIRIRNAAFWVFNI